MYTYIQKSNIVKFCVVLFEMLYGQNILILRQRNLNKQCLFRFFCLNIKSVCSDFSVSILRFVTTYAVENSKDYNTKFDHAELLSLCIYVTDNYHK